MPLYLIWVKKFDRVLPASADRRIAREPFDQSDASVIAAEIGPLQLFGQTNCRDPCIEITWARSGCARGGAHAQVASRSVSICGPRLRTRRAWSACRSDRRARRGNRSDRHELAASVKADQTAKRLMTIPGVGPLTAIAIVATIQDAGAFASGREFAAFLGLTSRQNSTGGKTWLGRITKMGDRYLRKLLVVGACAMLRRRRGHNDALRLRASEMLERKTVSGGARQQSRAHRLRADDEGRPRRSAGRGLNERSLTGSFRRRGRSASRAPTK